MNKTYNYLNNKILVITTLMMTVSYSVYLILIHQNAWIPYIKYDNGKLLFWKWFYTSLYIIIAYNIFRVHSYIYQENKSQQDSLKNIMWLILRLIFIVFLPFIIHYFFSVFSHMWNAQSSGGNWFWRIAQIILGFGFLIIEKAHSFARELVRGALQTIGIPHLAKEIIILGFAISAYDILASIVIALLVIHRKVIVLISRFLYSLLVLIKNIIYGTETTMVEKKGLRGILSGATWLKGLVFFLLDIKEKKDTSRGSADLATKAEEREILHKKKEGLLIDGTQSITWDLSMRHLAVIAPSGQGKTSNYVIPNILSLPEFINPKSGTSASAVITDPKGEIFETTAQYLSEKGYKIQVIRVDAPLQSELFNPIHRASSDKEIAKLAKIMVDSVTEEGKGDFWNASARMTLANIIKIIKRSNVPTEYHNLHNIKRFIDLMGSDGKPLVDFVKDHCEDAEAITEYASFTQQNDRTVSSILMTIKTVLKDLSVREIAQLTSKDTLDFSALRSEKSVLYIITPFSDIEYYRFFLTNLYSQLFAYCEKNSKGNDILFMMDEFGNLGKIPSFPQLITTMRSKRCSMSIILQDIEQLRMVYGKSAASSIINGGCSSQILFGGIRNIETLEEVSKMLGDKTMQQKSDNGKTISSFSRRLMTPDEIGRMQRGEGLFMSSISKPMKLKMVQFEDSHLKERLRKDDFGDYIVPPTHDREESELPVRYFDFDQYIKDEDE